MLHSQKKDKSSFIGLLRMQVGKEIKMYSKSAAGTVVGTDT